MQSECKTEILARKQPWAFGVQLVFAQKYSNGDYSLGRVAFEPHEKGMVIPDSAQLELTNDKAQLLMDELWNCGIRPSEGTGSAGSLKKTEDHLKDMRKIAFKALKMDI